MKFKFSWGFFWFGFLSLGIIIAYFIFIQTSLFEYLQVWAIQNFWILFIAICFLRFLSLAYPPLPGGVFTLGAIPLIGWQYAFIADFTGSISGGIFNYWLARKYGLKVIKNLMGDDVSEKLAKVKFKKGKEIEGLILTRVFIGSLLLEIIHYAAGLFKMEFHKYLIGLLISQVIMGFTFFYLLGEISSGSNILYILPFALLIVFLLYKYRKRYLDI